MKITQRAKLALWDKAELKHDSNGYLLEAKQNLIKGVTPQMIEADYANGSGQEWLRKIRAIHSSSALVANTFGRWKIEPEKLELLGYSGFRSLKLEAKLPTGLRGTPPHIDVLLESNEIVIGIESKLLEPLKRTKPTFSRSYLLAKLQYCETPWMTILEKTMRAPLSYLDSSQLIKHSLGLQKQYPEKKVILLYLYWTPTNVADIDEYSCHARDLDAFCTSIQDSEHVKFCAMTYSLLWESWSKNSNLSEHATLLTNRYCVGI